MNALEEDLLELSTRRYHRCSIPILLQRKDAAIVSEREKSNLIYCSENSFDGLRTFCFGRLFAERECREDTGVGEIKLTSLNPTYSYIRIR